MKIISIVFHLKEGIDEIEIIKKIKNLLKQDGVNKINLYVKNKEVKLYEKEK